MKPINIERSPSGEMDGKKMCGHTLRYHDRQIMYSWSQDNYCYGRKMIVVIPTQIVHYQL